VDRAPRRACVFAPHSPRIRVVAAVPHRRFTVQSPCAHRDFTARTRCFHGEIAVESRCFCGVFTVKNTVERTLSAASRSENWSGVSKRPERTHPAKTGARRHDWHEGRRRAWSRET
jgi:hypothetical protein